MKGIRLVVVVAPLALVGGLIYGCGVSDRPSAAGDGTTIANEERCTEPGAVRDCYSLVSADNGGIRTCMAGIQRCEASGVWSGCQPQGDGLFESSFGIDPSPAGDEAIRTAALSNPTPDAAACRANPCNPYCRGHEEDAGPRTLDASLRLDALVPFPGVTPGFEDKLLQDDCPSHNYTGACETYPTGNKDTAKVAAACQADSYCSPRSTGGSGCCIKYQPTETHATMPGAVVCATSGPDLTLAGACTLNGRIIVPFCNRGSGAVAAGATIRASVETPTLAQGWNPAPGTCWPAANDDCTVTLTEALNPGQCQFFIENLNCGSLQGNRLLAVNSRTSPVAECTLDVKDTVSNVAVNQPGCWNNITAFNAQQLPTCPTSADPQTFTETYRASCAPGERPRWGTIGWRASTPGLYVWPAVDQRSQIVFEARVRDTQNDGAVTAWTAYTTVGETRISNRPPAAAPPNPPTWGPNVCVAGVGGCPKEMFAALGGVPFAEYTELELRITMTGAAAFNPTLIAWYVTYSCVPLE